MAGGYSHIATNEIIANSYYKVISTRVFLREVEENHQFAFCFLLRIQGDTIDEMLHACFKYYVIQVG